MSFNNYFLNLCFADIATWWLQLLIQLYIRLLNNYQDFYMLSHSQNHRMLESGWDLCSHLIQPPCARQECWKGLPLLSAHSCCSPPLPKLKEQAIGPAGACTPYVRTHRALDKMSGDRACGCWGAVRSQAVTVAALWHHRGVGGCRCFKLRLVGTCDEKLVPWAQRPGNGQPSNASREPWWAPWNTLEHPDQGLLSGQKDLSFVTGDRKP